MHHSVFEDGYIRWLVVKLNNPTYLTQRHCLIDQLYDTNFTFTMEMDGNRADDGYELRHQFVNDISGTNLIMRGSFRNKPVSILEVMVALACRMEDNIMYDPDYGDRTGYWFKCMLDSLGLYDWTDDGYEEYEVACILDAFVNREYYPDGRGSLFYVKNTRKDLTTVDIWYQMFEFLNTIPEKGV